MAHGWRTSVTVVRRNHLIDAAAADDDDGGDSGGYLNSDRTSCTNGVDRMLIADAPDMT